MLDSKERIKLENVKKLIRRNAKVPLEKLLNKLHPADLALIITNLSDLDRKKIWTFIEDRSKIAKIILEMQDVDIVNIIEELTPQEAAALLSEMDSDDASYVLRIISKEKQHSLLQYISKDELFAVGEYWSGDVSKLHRYITETEGKISLFDVPLHYNLYNASKDFNYDLSKIFEHTLIKENPAKAVTFVDNHDTQPGQSLASFVEAWFKQAAYSLILLRSDGYPCVFYGDYFGIEHDKIPHVKYIKTMIELRKEKAYGIQHDYFDNPNYIGWTLEGDDEHISSGLAVVITNKGNGQKKMYVGIKHAGEKYIDALSNCQDEVIIDSEGYGEFKVSEKSTSIWVSM